MLVDGDIKENFYKVILAAKNVVLVVHRDVDALCSSVILTDLFERDEVVFSIVVIKEWREIRDTFRDFRSSSNTFVLINCGAFRSLLEFEVEGLEIFVIDSQRPISIENAHATQAVNVLIRPGERPGLNLPPFECLFDPNEGEDSDEDEENDENVDVSSRIQRRLLRKRNKELWETTREKLLWEYNVKTYIEYPTAVFLLQLAHSLGKSSAELSWCACIALTSLYIDNIISLQTYNNICVESMRTFTRLYAPRSHVKNDSTLRISFNKELVLPLYSHWTLHESVTHDVNFITQCRLWTQNGINKLRSSYARLGIPLAECNGNYNSIPNERRQQLFETIEGEMQTMNASFATFFSHFAFSKQFSAADFARLVSLKMEYSDKKEDYQDMFIDSMDYLKKSIWRNGGHSPETDQAIETYKKVLHGVVNLAFDCMRQSFFMNTNTFYALYVPELPEAEFLELSPHCMGMFMHMALRIFASVRRGYRIKKPLIISITPKVKQPDEDVYCIISGIMPLQNILTDPDRRSLIPRLFVTLHEDDSLDTKYESVNPNVIMVRESNRINFFENVESRLL